MGNRGKGQQVNEGTKKTEKGEWRKGEQGKIGKQTQGTSKNEERTKRENGKKKNGELRERVDKGQ